MKELSMHEMSQIKGGGPIGIMPFLEFAVICLVNGLTSFEWDDGSWVCY